MVLVDAQPSTRTWQTAESCSTAALHVSGSRSHGFLLRSRVSCWERRALWSPLAKSNRSAGWIKLELFKKTKKQKKSCDSTGWNQWANTLSGIITVRFWPEVQSPHWGWRTFAEQLHQITHVLGWQDRQQLEGTSTRCLFFLRIKGFIQLLPNIKNQKIKKNQGRFDRLDLH